jgi:hypothetical protein
MWQADPMKSNIFLGCNSVYTSTNPRWKRTASFRVKKSINQHEVDCKQSPLAFHSDRSDCLTEVDHLFDTSLNKLGDKKKLSVYS